MTPEQEFSSEIRQAFLRYSEKRPDYESLRRISKETGFLVGLLAEVEFRSNEGSA